MPGFDLLAKPYEPLERLCFGNALVRTRCHFLQHLSNCKRGLLIGDGDGRFSSKLLQTNRAISLDSIDISPAMLNRATRRLPQSSRNRLQPIVADALQYSYPIDYYDFLALNFVLDCFTQTQVHQLLPKLENALRTNGLILYSDFRDETAWQRIILKVLYLCFKATTGLQTRSLPKINWSPRIQKLDEKRFKRGLLETQLLRKSNAAARENY